MNYSSRTIWVDLPDRFIVIHMNEMNVLTNRNMRVIQIYYGKYVTKVNYDRPETILGVLYTTADITCKYLVWISQFYAHYLEP